MRNLQKHLTEVRASLLSPKVFSVVLAMCLPTLYASFLCLIFFYIAPPLPSARQIPAETFF